MLRENRPSSSASPDSSSRSAAILADRLQHPEALVGVAEEALVDERLQDVEVGLGDLLRQPRACSRRRRPPAARTAAAPRRRAARGSTRSSRAASAGAGRRRAPPLSRSRRWESRSRICAGERTLARAAASSTASGRLSRLGRARRSSSSRLEPERVAEELDRLGFGERQHRVLDLASDAQQLAARDEQPEVRAGFDERGELGCRVDHLLEVVEQEQQLPLADVLGEAVLGAERLRDRRRATSAGSRSAARPTQKTPALNSGTSSAAASIASRVLPEPPGPVSVSRRAPSRAASELLDLSLPAHERARRARQVRVRDRLQRREALRSRAGRSRPASAKSFSRCSPRSLDFALDELARLLRQRHLAAVPAAAIRAAVCTSCPT